eukprot:gene47078-63049_t
MSGECIQVVVRCRPFNKKEINENRGNAIKMDTKLNQCFITNVDAPNDPPKMFTFDGVYDEHTIQRQFYEESCFPLVESVLEGFNGTVFAYGQTGCGKTWTMQGPWNPPELREIYNEEINDLLADSKSEVKCDIREDPQRGIFVANLSDVVVETEKEMDAVLNRGKLNLVDLAGSERQKKTGASGDRLKEGTKINLSLSALGNVISALSEGKGGHIPYRDSKLTR